MGTSIVRALEATDVVRNKKKNELLQVFDMNQKHVFNKCATLNDTFLNDCYSLVRYQRHSMENVRFICPSNIKIYFDFHLVCNRVGFIERERKCERRGPLVARFTTNSRPNGKRDATRNLTNLTVKFVRTLSIDPSRAITSFLASTVDFARHAGLRATVPGKPQFKSV